MIDKALLWLGALFAFTMGILLVGGAGLAALYWPTRDDLPRYAAPSDMSQVDHRLLCGGSGFFYSCQENWLLVGSPTFADVKSEMIGAYASRGIQTEDCNRERCFTAKDCFTYEDVKGSEIEPSQWIFRHKTRIEAATGAVLVTSTCR